MLFRSTFSGLRPLTDPVVLAVFADCRTRMNIHIRLSLVESRAVSCPALYGLFHPRLVLPLGFATHFSEHELRFIFLHELAHLKRLDLPLNWLFAVLQVIHWFNPLVWVGFARWRVDREVACDAMTLDVAGAEQNHEYGRTILHLLAGFTRPTPTPGLIGILENKQQLRQRISTIAAYAPARRLSLLTAALVAALGVVSLTDARNQSPNPTTTRKDRASTEEFGTHSAGPLDQPRRVVTNGVAVKVIVLDKDTGSRLANAEVLAPNQAAFFGGVENSPRWTTDASGSVVIRLGEIPSEPISQNAWFTISVRRSGYAPAGLSWSVEKGDARAQILPEITVHLQHGVTIGGRITDQTGVPQTQVQVRAFGCGYSYERFRERSQEYPEFWASKGFAGAPTDAEGYWSLPDFPRDLENVAIVATGADGSTHTFRHSAKERNPLTAPAGEPLDLSALREAKALFVLKPGFCVQGTVVDPDGRPLPAVLVKEGYGAVNLKRGAEVRTDGVGNFKFLNRAARQMILTAYAKGFAITSTIVDVGPNALPVRLQLDRLRPLPIRVLDGKGAPIAGAKIRVGYKTEGQVLDLDAATDQDGIFIWSNAPHSSFALTACSPKAPAFSNYGFNQMIKVKPEQTEVTFRLREGMEKGLVVHGKARDAKTGAPVVVKAVDFQNADREGFSRLEEVDSSDFQLRIPVTKFRQGMEAAFDLRLEADGYETLVTPWRNFLEGDWDTELVFVPGGSPGGTVLLPNGEPAAGAEVAVLTREHLSIYIYFPNRAPSDWTQVVRADENGRFQFRYPGGDWAVVLMHKGGFLATTADRFRTQPRISLEPWGRVEGILHVDTNAAPRQGISLSGGKPVMKGWHFIFSTDTDDEGRFSFDQVPPGEGRLYRSSKQGSGPNTPVYQMPVTVTPGEVTRVDYGGTGCRVIGRVEGEADWNKDDHLLVLKVPPAPTHPRVEDFATITAFEKARDEYYATERPKEEQAARSYPLRFEQDGSFRIDDVPAGSYELRIQVTEPRKDGEPPARPGTSKEIASLTREVVVPEVVDGRSDKPLDLGVLQLQWTGKAAPRTKP